MPVNAAHGSGRLRIACLSTYGGHSGGAAIAMHRLAAALEDHGATVDILARHGPEGRGVPESPRDAAHRRRIRRAIRKARTPLSNTLFSADWPAWDVAGDPIVAAADIIHVHWVAGFLAAESISSLVATGKPVVWTQHDQRAFTGGCHYAAGCSGFTADCSRCPQLQSTAHALPKRTLARSRRRLRGLPLTFVSPSRWLAGELARSSLFDAAHHGLEVIPNGIDLGRYTPCTNKAAARARLGLPAAGLAIVLGGVSLAESRKGGRQAALAIESLAAKLRGCSTAPPVVVTYGAGSLPLQAVICRHLGATDEQGVIAALHACDVHLTMTREDNLPNTVVEALACGLPVVGTRTGGLPEMVRDGVEGWLVPCDDAAGAAGVLGRLAHEGGLVAGAARAARERAELAFDARLQARRHIELFHSLLERPTPVPSRPSPAGLRVIRMTPGVVPLLSHARIIRQTLRRMRRGLAGGRAATPGLPDSPKSPKP